MSITKHPKYPGVWVIVYYPDGRRKDPKTGKASTKRDRILFEGDEAQARDYYADLLRSVRPAATLVAPTLAQAWPDFCLYYKNNTSATTYNDFLKTWHRHLEPFFGSYRPNQLTGTLIEQYKAKRLAETYLPGKRYQLPAADTPEESARRKPISKKRIQNELFYISAMTSWMARPDVNYAKPLPFKIQGFPAKEVKAPLPVIPDRREVILLLRKADRLYRPMLCSWYYGGMRKSEVLTMEGERVNLSQGYMIVRGKGNKERIVPIYRKLRVYLRKHWQPGLLWANPKTQRPYVFLTRALKRAADRAGFDKHLYLHLLRHSFGTHGIQSGINPRAMQLLLGHESMKTTELYTTLAAGALSMEMEKLGKKEPSATAMLQEIRSALRHLHPPKKGDKSAA